MKYRDLEVWQLSMTQAEEVYRLAETMPFRRKVLHDKINPRVSSIHFG